jgi:hypothetical protein
MSEGDWQRVHKELTRLARSRAILDAEEAGWLVKAVRVRVHERLGCGSVLEYLERVLGYGPRLAKERLRVAEALSRLPTLRTALASGELAWSAVRELSRVTTAATEAEWAAAARAKTVRQIEEMVSGRRSGDRPSDPADPSLRRHILRLEISADALAAFRDARRYLECEVGHSLEDDEMVRMLAHHALGGTRDAGRAPYQVAMTVCTECRRGTRDGAGQVFDVETERVDAALCDAQQVFIDTHPTLREAPDSFDSFDTHPTPRETPDSFDTHPTQRETPDSCDTHPTQCETPGPSLDSFADAESSAHPDAASPVRPDSDVASPDGQDWSVATREAEVPPSSKDRDKTRSFQTHVGPHEPDALQRDVSVSRPLQSIPERPAVQLPPLVPAATQTIPPRIRRLIWRRDHRRCKVPGCRAARCLEIHHLVPLSEGGDHNPARMLLLCDGHHARVHTGRLRINGIAPDRLVFTHANGAPYGQIDRAIDLGPPSDVGAQHGLEADAVGALRRTGVSLGDARRAVAEAARSRPAAIVDLIRQAFIVLGRTAYASRMSERRASYFVRGRRPMPSERPVAPASRSGMVAAPWPKPCARDRMKSRDSANALSGVGG